MKKFAKWLMVALLALALFSCKKENNENNENENQTEEISAALKQAKSYLTTMYLNDATATASDYTRVAQLTLGGVTYSIEWKVTVTTGQASDVVIVKAEDGTTVTVDVNDKSESEIAYTITATIKDAEGKTVDVSWDHTVPAFKELSYAEYIAAATDDTVVVKGVVTAMSSKTNGNSYNTMYLQDADGGYYVYSMSEDPVAAGVQVGMTVRVTGTKSLYSGTIEITDAAVEIIDSTITTVEPADYTEVYKNAAALTDDALVGKQAILVTIKGVTLTTINTSNGYYSFKLGNLETYVRISSSVCPMTKDQQTAMKANHKQGYTADVTGVVCIYSGAFYLTPVNENAISNLQLPELSDADAVAFEKDALTLSTEITAAGEYAASATGAAYSKVAISYTSDNELVTFADGKMVVSAMPQTTTEVKVTATLTAGDSTDTKEFTVKLIASKSFVSEALKAGAALENKATSTDQYIIIGTVSEIKTAYSEQYGNVSFYVTDGTQSILVYRYTLDDAATIKVGDYVSFAANLQNYNGTIECVATFVKVATTSIPAANEIANGTDDAAKQGVTIYGQITEIKTAYSAQYNNITFTVSDGTNTFLCYRVKGGEDLTVGDYVMVTGNVTVYNTTIEYSAGATYTKSNIYAVPATYTAAVASDSDADATVTLSAESAEANSTITVTVTVPETKEIVEVSVNGTALTAAEDGTYSFKITADSTVKVTLKEKGAADPTPVHAGTAEDPYTVADANLVISKLANKVYTDQVYIKALVTKIVSKTTYVSNVTLADSADSTTTILVYSANFTDDVKDISVGDTVTFYGFLVNYNGTYEVSNNTVDGTKVQVTMTAITRGNGTVATAETSSANATVTYSATAGENGSTVTATVVASDGYQIVTVKANGTELTANEDGTYTVTIDGATTVTVETAEAGVAQPEKVAEFSFADLTTGTYEVTDYEVTAATDPDGVADSGDETAAVTGKLLTWVQGKVTFINAQATSATSVANATASDGTTKVPYTNPIRIYKSQNITVKYDGMVKVVFHCAANYVEGLQGSTFPTTATVTVDGNDVVVTFAEAVNELTITGASKAYRMNSIDIYAMPGTVEEEPTYVAFIGETGYETLAAAMEAAQSGDVIVLSAGEYADDLTVKDGVSIQGATPELELKHSDTFTVDATTQTVLKGVVTVKGENELTLQGLVFAKQLVVAGQKDLTVANCVFTGVVDAGVGQLTVTAKSDNLNMMYCYTNCASCRFVYFQASSTDFTYDSCSTLDVASGTVAIYDIVRLGVANETLVDGNVTICNSYFGKSNQAGVYCRFGNSTDALAAFTANYEYSNNYFYQNPAAIWHRGVTLVKAVDYTVTYNTFVECGDIGLDWDVLAITNFPGTETEAASKVMVSYNVFANSFTVAGTNTDYIVKLRKAQTTDVDCSYNYFTTLVNGNLQLNATGVETSAKLAVNSYVQEEYDLYKVVESNDAGELSIYGINVFPLIRIAVWANGTNDAVWVTDDEITATQAKIVAYLTEKGYAEGTYKLEFTKITTEGNTVAQYGAATNDDTYDFIIGCGANVTTKGLVTVAEKVQVPTTIFAAGRYVARITDNEIAKLIFAYYQSEVDAAATATTTA